MIISRPKNKFEDERGLIANLTPDVHIQDILYITGKKGAVRGNHYHKLDTHYCYVVEGILDYEYIGHDGEVKTEKLFKGDIVFTPPLEKHRFTFLTDGAFIALATQSRKQEDYEEDTVREDF